MTRLACTALALAAATAATGACGKGDGKEAGKEGAAAGDLPADFVASVNAAVPADLKDKIQFEAGRVVENEKRGRGFKAAVPKGWKPGKFIPGTLEPADADNFDSKTLGKTQMNIGKNCDGMCEKKDWAQVSDKVLYKQFTSGQVEGKVLKDEKRSNGRTLVFERKPGMFPERDVAIHVYTSWWEPDATEYYTCSAELGAPMKGAAEAFEKACSKVIKDPAGS
jgi:hypothetical protein